MTIEVTFKAGEGLIIQGTSRSQAATLKPIMSAHGLRWSGSLGAWFKPQSRSWSAADYRIESVHAIARDLTSAGMEAVADISRETVDAADKEASRQARSEARAERLDERADKHAQAAAGAFKRAHTVADGIPMGQPILVGHHSERHHRADVKRIDNAMRKGCEASNEAARLRGASIAAERNAQGKTRSQMDRKIKELEAEGRTLARRASEYGGDTERHAILVSENANALAYWRDSLAAIGFDEVKEREGLQAGQIVLHRGHPAIIRRMGPKNATVRWLRSPELGDQSGAAIVDLRAISPEQEQAARVAFADALASIDASDRQKKAKPDGWHWKGKRTTPGGHPITDRSCHGFWFQHATDPSLTYWIHFQEFGDRKYSAEVTHTTPGTFGPSRKSTRLGGRLDTLAEALALCEGHAANHPGILESCPTVSALG